MATDHDAILERILPQAGSGMLREAQWSIAELGWDDSDSLDPEQDPRSLVTRSRLSMTNSISEVSTYTGHSGGLSAPRRVAPAFADFDSVAHPAEDMDDEAAEVHINGGARKTDQFTQGQGGVQVIIEPVAELLPRKPGSRTSQSAASRSSSLRHRSNSRDTQDPIEVPPRLSSRMGKTPEVQGGGNGIIVNDGNAYAYPYVNATRPTTPAGTIRLAGTSEQTHPVTRGGIIIRDEEDSDEEEDDEEEEDMEAVNDQVKKRWSQIRPKSPVLRDMSSTPPPISNPRSNRVIVHDDFEEEDEPDDNYLDTAYEDHEIRGISDLALYREETRKPPSTYRNQERRLGSKGSDRVRSHAPASNSRTAALTTNYRGLRGPVLDQGQLYQEMEPKRPLFDRATATRSQRHTYQKPHRSTNDGLYTGYTAAGAAAAAAANTTTNTIAQDHPRDMSLRRRFSESEASVRPSFSGKTVASVGSQNMPDFFTSSIFQVVLHNPITAHQLHKFSESRLCAENVDFLSKVDAYRTTLNELAGQMATIHKTFISPGSQSQINAHEPLLKRAHKDMKSLINNAFPSMENVFAELQEQIETMVFQDVYPQFVRHQMVLSASKALASDRFKYQGLGDCFCLTNPTIADNPIVFASDGFVKVTGYTRPEIIPRNCRFLQGSYTDRQPVQRLRKAIHEKKESVELLLNYKKNGDPFWNLLYVVPLFNVRGKCEFFLGGQVNCSTTIHSNADVMKVLSMSTASEGEGGETPKVPVPSKQSLRPSARRTLLKALGVRQDDRLGVQMGEAGMENGILNRMEGQDLGAQMKEFYTAYSKYLVVRASTFTIEFYSDGVVEGLNPANLATSMVAGSEIFRFLGQNMLTKQSEYKTRVRNAIRAGVPISTPLRLQTRRSAVFRGDEAFVAHWTPLKDEKAMVHWIVVTLAPTL